MQLVLGGGLTSDNILIHKTMCMKDLSVWNYVNNNCVEEVQLEDITNFRKFISLIWYSNIFVSVIYELFIILDIPGTLSNI